MKYREIMAITDGKIQIRAGCWLEGRKKPVLSVLDMDAGTLTKYAIFNNEEAAEKFMNILCDFIGIDRSAVL